MDALLDIFNNLSSRVFSLLWSKKTTKMAMLIFLMMTCVISLCNWFTCPASSSTTNTITSEQFSFSSYSSSKSYNVVSGTVTNSLYFSYLISTPNNWAIRKINKDSTSAWMTSLSFDLIQNSLTVDDSESYIYVGSYTDMLEVVRLASGTGALVDAQRL